MKQYSFEELIAQKIVVEKQVDDEPGVYETINKGVMLSRAGSWEMGNTIYKSPRRHYMLESHGILHCCALDSKFNVWVAL